ncbi:MAG: hypothetical protein ACH255_04525 [Candidatus Thiodiazotropha sp.]
MDEFDQLRSIGQAEGGAFSGFRLYGDRIGVLIPCHRVLRGDGKLGG